MNDIQRRLLLFHKLQNTQGRLHEIQERCINIKLRGYGSLKRQLKLHIVGLTENVRFDLNEFHLRVFGGKEFQRVEAAKAKVLSLDIVHF